MKYVALLLILLATAGCAGCASLPPPKSSYGAAVRIVMDDGQCSATAVARHILLTAAHCFSAPAGLMKVDERLSEYVIAADDGRDHVLVLVGVTLPKVAKIGRPPRFAQTLSMIGNPLGFYNLFRTGRVAGWHDKGPCPDGTRTCRVMLADLETAGGDSGAGYFNARGEVVGVHTGAFELGPWMLAYSHPLAFTDEQLELIR